MVLLAAVFSLFHWCEQWDGGEQCSPGVVWVMDTPVGCLQQSWVDISLDFPWTSTGKAAEASSVLNRA